MTKPAVVKFSLILWEHIMPPSLRSEPKTMSLLAKDAGPEGLGNKSQYHFPTGDKYHSSQNYVVLK